MQPAFWGLVGLVVLIILNGFLSTTQLALSNVRRQGLRERAERGNKRARLALELAEESFRLMSTFKLASLIVYFLMAALLSLLVIPPAANWLAEATTLSQAAGTAISYLVIIPLSALLAYLLGETLPEVLVQRDPVAWSMRIASAARIVFFFMTPLVKAVLGIRRQMASSGAQSADSALVTEEEIMTLVDAGEEEGSIEQEEKEMIYSIFQLDETLAREIMVPRIDVAALDINASLEEAREVIIKAGHSRIPVYEDSLDHIRGLLYAKDLLTLWHTGQQSANLADLLRPALFVPESKRVSDLLHELQAEKVHMAVVIDEYGGTAGLATIEDIVEEIVGEILDEYDEDEEAAFEAVGPGEYIFDARIDLDDFNRLLNTELPDEMGDTLAGFIYAQLGKVPEVGEIILTERLTMEVLDVIDRRIRKVRVKLMPKPAAPPEANNNETDNHARKNGIPH